MTMQRTVSMGCRLGVLGGLLGGLLLLAGCGASASGDGSGSGSGTSGDATVNFTVSDTPPTAVTVLSFQVQIASAVLQPGNVSLLPRAVTVDLAQLASDTGFLASEVIGSGTYTSMTLTLANPQVTLMNNTSGTLSLNEQSCAAGAVCTYTPALDQASVTVSNGVFPLTVTASSSTGLNLDLSIPDLLQSDLSVSLANGSSANLSLLPAASKAAQQAEIADVLGTVTSVSGSTINVTTAFGDSLVLTTGGTTVYKYPAAMCASNTSACVTVGQVVTTDLSMLGDGSLGVNALSYAGASGAQVVKGLVLSAASGSAQMLVQREVNASGLAAGQVATVSMPAGATFGVGTAVYPAVTGGGFASAADVIAGQEVVASVGSGLVTGSAPAFTAGTVYLESSQVVGEIATVNSGSGLITMNGLSGLFTGERPAIQQVDVQTDSATEYTGYSVGSFSALAADDFLAAKGPLFNAGGVPTVGAVELRARTIGN
ncbi:MAG: DUF4382 domain-containing protein [Acidobacteriaceae bacterium]